MPSAEASRRAAFDFLALLARPQPEPERVRMLLGTGLDFDEVTRLAAEHGVRPQLVDGLARISWLAVPAGVRRQLETWRHAHLARTLLIAEELRRVAELFAQRGIRHAVFKGVTLARMLYGDPAAREYNDIDLIVPREQMAAAERALASLGYHGAQGDAVFREAFLSYQRQYAFVRDGLVSIDLHWAFCGCYLPFPLAVDDVWHDVASISIGPQSVPTLAAANLALLLAGHGTKEQWRCLEWINDFGHLVVSAPDLDWSAIHARASEAGCGNSVLLGAVLAETLLDVPVPAALASLAGAAHGVQRRARNLIEGLRRGVPEPGVAPNFTDLDLCDRAGDRVKAVLGLVFTPTAGDYGAMPLPRRFWGLYHATRPFRLAAKAASRLGAGT